MFLSALLVACLAWPAFVLSLQVKLTPKQRNVTQGAKVNFDYLPHNNQTTNITILDTLTNKTFPLFENVDNRDGHKMNWTVPEDMEVHGGYFYVVKQQVNNATIQVMSDSEFQVLAKVQPAPPKDPHKDHKNSGASLSVGTSGLLLSSIFVLAIGTLGL